MRIIFMGTPDFAVPTLKMLVEEGYDVCGVFTQPDKPKGRGHKTVPTPVKEYALSMDIPVYQPKTLKSDESKELFKQINPDLAVVVAYGKVLPKEILDMPKYGCINVHASLLPKYRGAGPIQWSIINGETETGVTTMYMAEGIDTGDMLLSEKTPIGENETAGELHDRLSELGADVMKKTMVLLEKGELNPIKQDDSKTCHAPMLTKELSVMDFSKTASELHNLVRGITPWPSAETRICGKRVKVYRTEIIDKDIENAEYGRVIDTNKLIVACKKGILRLLEVQPEGSKRMSDEAYLRGRPVEKETVLGE